MYQKEFNFSFTLKITELAYSSFTTYVIERSIFCMKKYKSNHITSNLFLQEDYEDYSLKDKHPFQF